MPHQIHPRRAEVLAELVLYELAEAEDPATFMPMPADARARQVAATRVDFFTLVRGEDRA